MNLKELPKPQPSSSCSHPSYDRNRPFYSVVLTETFSKNVDPDPSAMERYLYPAACLISNALGVDIHDVDSWLNNRMTQGVGVRTIVRGQQRELAEQFALSLRKGLEEIGPGRLLHGNGIVPHREGHLIRPENIGLLKDDRQGLAVVEYPTHTADQRMPVAPLFLQMGITV